MEWGQGKRYRKESSPSGYDPLRCKRKAINRTRSEKGLHRETLIADAACDCGGKWRASVDLLRVSDACSKRREVRNWTMRRFFGRTGGT